MKNSRKLFVISLLFCLSATSYAKEKELLFYIGITMIKPVQELVVRFEKKYNCKIKILQGGSQDLYDSIKMSKIGDVYLPGSVVYRYKNLKDGLLQEGKFVGYNKLALVVKKGNPKNIKASLDELANEKLRVAIGNAHSGSIGNASKKSLIKKGIYKKVILNTSLLAPDSRTLIKLLKEDKVDLLLNWYATTFWKGNKEFVEALEIDDEFSNKSKLVFNILSTSKHKDLSKKFIEFAASKEGREVFYRYGFLSDDDLKNFDKVSF